MLKAILSIDFFLDNHIYRCHQVSRATNMAPGQIAHKFLFFEINTQHTQNMNAYYYFEQARACMKFSR